MSTPIDRGKVQRLLQQEAAQLVEVLPAEDYERWHLAGAVNIPLKELDTASTAALVKSRPVIVY